MKPEAEIKTVKMVTYGDYQKMETWYEKLLTVAKEKYNEENCHLIEDRINCDKQLIETLINARKEQDKKLAYAVEELKESARIFRKHNHDDIAESLEIGIEKIETLAKIRGDGGEKV